MGTIAKLPKTERAALKKHVKPAFVPKVKKGEGKGPVSKLGGRPWLPKGEKWPTCPNCKQPMQLMLQLELAKLPKGTADYGQGLAQLFYCTNNEPLCEVDCEAYFPFAKSVVARVVKVSKDGKDAEAQKVPNPIVAKTIVGWEKVDDLPQQQELQELGEEVPYDGPLAQALEKARLPHAGDKLGGWPLWVQGIEYPACPDCKKPMRLVYQIDSDDKIEYGWGDGGVAHLSQCATHKHQLGFGWACG